MDNEPEGRPGSPRLLGAVACQGVALASPLPILLFKRVEIADRLDLLGAITTEAALLGAVAAVAALVVPRLRDKLPAGAMLMLGGLTAAVGLGLMAWTIELALFTVGGVLLAAGSAPGLVTHRILLTTDDRPADRFRTMSWYWGAVATGASWPLVVLIFAAVGYDTLLWISAALTLVAALWVGRHALAHDGDQEAEVTVARLDVPWARRSYGAAFAVGAVVIGGADAAQSLLLGEWQRSAAQNAAVLAAGTGAAALICLFGPWYHRLHRLGGSRRSDAIGTQLLIAGALIFLGGLSFTYIGLVVCWLFAGGAIALAAAGLDAAVFPALAPAIRRSVAARQVLWTGAGALVGSVANAQIIGTWSDQWKIGWLGLPLLVAGWAIRRFASPARDAETAVAKAQDTTVPRRVFDADSHAPLLCVEQVSVAYGSVQVLFEVDLRVEEGAVVALLGTNGAGKTTLLRAISGLEPTIGGRIVYAGLDITKTRPTWRVAMGLHQIVGGEAVVGPLTVADNLSLFAHGVSRSQRDQGIDEAYRLFPRLAERSSQRASTLSGGEKQMLSLAKAIISPPRLLLIDEFSLGLAPAVIADLLPVVRRIADQGAAVLLVEQSVNIALSVADHAYVMEKGEIGHSGPAAELRTRPDLLQAAYLEGLAQALRTSGGGTGAQ
ncbi:ATP-binding cassette domain-containing protein [Candidatus Poriferisocius sp.]|uniref:ATP-binding cassette domain-containing protein n=1 Tax=Candidatus Poriferisocius sp. TaxID=3101276 RepID=UPI003B51D610